MHSPIVSDSISEAEAEAVSEAEAASLASAVEDVVRWLRRSLPVELSQSGYAALSRLQREGPLRISDLAAEEGITQPGSTVLVNRLAGGGYAERIADPTDGRATLVRATAAGERLVAQRSAARAALLGDRLAALSAQDREALLAALPALHRLAEAPSNTVDPSTTEKGR